MTLYQRRLQQVLEVLKEFKPEKVYSYGSWVNGNPSQESDIDMVAIVDDKTDILLLKRRLSERLWEEKYPYDLDPDIHFITKSLFNYRLSKNDPFVSNVSKGNILYG